MYDKRCASVCVKVVITEQQYKDKQTKVFTENSTKKTSICYLHNFSSNARLKNATFIFKNLRHFTV